MVTKTTSLVSHAFACFADRGALLPQPLRHVDGLLHRLHAVLALFADRGALLCQLLRISQPTLPAGDGQHEAALTRPEELEGRPNHGTRKANGLEG